MSDVIADPEMITARNCKALQIVTITIITITKIELS